jgi:Dehydrogenases with different specificities (related to short-chain alcohol dehydrogenases)
MAWGVQMAYALGEAGANLVIAARKVDKLKATADKMEKELGIKVVPARLDLTLPEEIDALFELVKKEYGKVDILVNNSGAIAIDSVFKFPLDKWHQVIDTNLTGLWLMCQKAGSMMAKQGYGRIINISSITGLVGQPSEFVLSPPYTASKAAILGLTRDLAVKWAKKNVTVNAVIPGWFGSDMGDMNHVIHDKLNEYYIPMGHFGGDDELKAAILFLASPGASYTTGIALPVDGGFVAQ